MKACTECGGVVVCAPRCGGALAQERKHFTSLPTPGERRVRLAEAVVEAHRANPKATARELAKETGASTDWVYAVARTHKLKLGWPVHRKLSEAQQEEARGMFRRGYSITNVALHLDVSRVCARECWREEHGPFPTSVKGGVQPKRTLTPEERELVLAQLRSGRRASDVAREWGLSSTHIYRLRDAAVRGTQRGAA